MIIVTTSRILSQCPCGGESVFIEPYVSTITCNKCGGKAVGELGDMEAIPNSAVIAWNEMVALKAKECANE